MSHNLRQLEYHLSEMGYTLGSNPKRKYWTIKGKGDERPIRLHRLGEEYTKERITQRLIEKHHIGTDEQLFSYQHSVEKQMSGWTL